MTPAILYGTAWKEERTEELTALALRSGFRGIDTANQRKHYYEAGVGAAIASSGIPRGELFIQTKFTYRRGQDQRLPYDPSASLSEQVRQSFESSLEHLQCEFIDSLVLHGPSSESGWSDQDREVWTAMEELVDAGRVGVLGVSNIALGQLATLASEARVPPSQVQNRCYARTGWDREVRLLCKQHGFRYQGFSLLTANRTELSSPDVVALAARVGGTVSQLVFRYAVTVGMLPLTGTSSAEHMSEDLFAIEEGLGDDDVAEFEALT